jgi:hypothetical protein
VSRTQLFCASTASYVCSNDILRQHGILPKKEAPPPSPSPPPSPTLDDLLDDFTPAELQELGDEAGNDETERMIAMYRRQRIADLKGEESKARFGRVYPIGREDYTREVTEASKINEVGDDKEQGTGVVCLLYKDGYVSWHSQVPNINIHFQATSLRTRNEICPNTCIPISSLQIRFHSRRQMHTQSTRFALADAYHLPKRRYPASACCVGCRPP